MNLLNYRIEYETNCNVLLLTSLTKGNIFNLTEKKTVHRKLD